MKVNLDANGQWTIASVECAIGGVRYYDRAIADVWRGTLTTACFSLPTPLNAASSRVLFILYQHRTLYLSRHVINSLVLVDKYWLGVQLPNKTTIRIVNQRVWV